LNSCLTVFPNDKLDYTQTDQWTSQEITLLSTDSGPLQWVAGLYYYNEVFTNPINLINAGQAQVAAPCYIIGYPPATASTAACSSAFGLSAAPANPSRDLAYLNYTMSENSYAGYGQIDWKITPQVKLTGGLRYTYDDEGGTEFLRAVAFGGSGLAGLAPILADPEALGAATPAVDETGALCFTDNAQDTPVRAEGRTSLCTVNANGDAVRTLQGSSSGLTGTAGVEWTPSDATLAYFRYSRGYKSLGFNAGYDLVGIPSSEVAPEFMNDYELGLKQRVGRTLTIDATLFYEDYINAQVPLGVQTLQGPATVLTNIPSTVSAGFELEANWAPIEHLNVSLSYAYDDTAVQSVCNTTTLLNCYIDAVNPGAGFQSIKGNELPNAPKNKLSLNAYYTFVFDPGSLTVSASYLWRDKQFGSVFNAPWWVAPSSSDVDLRATWQGLNDRYEIVGYVKNVFNSLQYEAGPAVAQAGDALNPSVYGQDISQNIDPPRTFGIEVHYKFF
jgi:iron complex outermembrane receptor protein